MRVDWATVQSFFDAKAQKKSNMLFKFAHTTATNAIYHSEAMQKMVPVVTTGNTHLIAKANMFP